MNLFLPADHSFLWSVSGILGQRSAAPPGAVAASALSPSLSSGGSRKYAVAAHLNPETPETHRQRSMDWNCSTVK